MATAVLYIVYYTSFASKMSPPKTLPLLFWQGSYLSLIIADIGNAVEFFYKVKVENGQWLGWLVAE